MRGGRAKKRGKKTHIGLQLKEDRISLLPEEILHRILCSLSQKEAIRTCRLSRAWRYVGCTRPKIDFPSLGTSAQEDSALDSILQANHDRNIRLDEFSVGVSSSLDGYAASILHKWIPTIIHNLCAKTFHLNYYDPKTTMMSEEPAQFFRLPSSIVESDHIQNLSLEGCEFQSSPEVRVSLQRLRRLRLDNVCIPEEILNSILSDCPFLEDVHLSDCNGITRIKMLNSKSNLAHFYFNGFYNYHNEGLYVSMEIGDHVQTLRTIQISECLLSFSYNMPLEFDRLTRLSLRRVQVLSESISCDLHGLEELVLDQCSGIKEFKLSSRSMKRLTINKIGTPFKATIDAPSMASFNYEGIFPQSISFKTTSNSKDLWESKINLESSPSEHERANCFNGLYGLLKALSQSESEVCLELDQIEIRRLWRQLLPIIGDSPTQQQPVVVEHLAIKSPENNRHPSAVPFLNRLFHMFRPSFIHLLTSIWTNSNKEYREMAEELFNFKERETAQSNFWQCVLEGVGLQVKYRKQNEWQPVEYKSFTQLSNKGADGREVEEYRIQLKWRK